MNRESLFSPKCDDLSILICFSSNDLLSLSLQASSSNAFRQIYSDVFVFSSLILNQILDASDGVSPMKLMKTIDDARRNDEGRRESFEIFLKFYYIDERSW
ncbi:unnamed protein product [Vicia faba]|uniref:Uncharacterized protein n=1 Tax=Vicia faba TaxID=3906 RepID=A0AAV0ZQS2_VICFA|nr:unnamed protein product [Vicia faba]